MNLNEIETRLSKLEGKREYNEEDRLPRLIIRSIVFVLLAALGAAYGCNRSDNSAKIETVRITLQSKQ